MSYITREDIALIEARYGVPVKLSTEISMSPFEMDIVRNSQKNGRAHDITMFIFKGEQLLFNAKHFYPTELFRAPSGGINPGEAIEDGAKREAYEETGARIELEKYLAKIEVRFFDRENNDKYIDWTSYVFKARYLSGEIKPLDTHEIREAKLIDISDIPKFNDIMLNSERGGFHYRAYLTKNIMRLLNGDSVK